MLSTFFLIINQFQLTSELYFQGQTCYWFKMNVMFLMFLLSPRSSNSSRFNNTIDSHDYEIVAICVNMLFLLLMWYKAPAKQLAQSSALASLTGLGKCSPYLWEGLRGKNHTYLVSLHVLFWNCTVPT